MPFELDATSVKVTNAATDQAIATLTGPDPTAAMRPIASASAETAENATAIAPSGTTIVWIDVAVATRSDIPQALEHEVDLTPVGAPPRAPANLNATLGRIRVNRTPAIVLGSPLAPGTWMVNDACA